MSEYAAFITAMRDGRKMRARMFDTIEQRHAHDFRSGDDGTRLYEGLLSAIRDSGDPEAVKEFECRFFPLVDPDNRAREENAKKDRGENRGHGGWAWASAACIAFITLGALLLGLNSLRMKTVERSILAGSSVPAAHASVPSQTTNQTAPSPAAESYIPADDAVELTGAEAMTAPAQVPAAEPELNPER